MSDRVRSCVPARASLLAVVLLFTAMMSACQGGGSSSGSAAGPQQVTIKAEDTMRFDPASVTVTVGRPGHLTLMNDGALTHDFVLNGGVAQPVKIEAAWQVERQHDLHDRPAPAPTPSSVPSPAMKRPA